MEKIKMKKEYWIEKAWDEVKRINQNRNRNWYFFEPAPYSLVLLVCGKKRDDRIFFNDYKEAYWYLCKVV